jgi:hypothetical protein
MSNSIGNAEASQSTTSRPKPLSRWMKFLVRPSKTGFESIRDLAGTSLTLVGLALAWELQSVVGLLVGTRGPAEFPGVLAVLLSPIFWIIAYYLMQIIIWFGARILGGTGTFLEQSNVIALTLIPVIVVDGLFDFARLTPLYENAISFLAVRMLFKVYFVVTIALALQVVHNLSAIKAWMIATVLLISYAIFLVIGVILYYPL